MMCGVGWGTPEYNSKARKQKLEGLKVRAGDKLHPGRWPEEQGSGTQSRNLN